ncbi:type IVB secretion system protein IcmH/DotU [Herbaspirillum sp. RTI4]|uniref:type IVB secretion system protein IcmH/DotU n=1 Tax=Herbaspirillum sp. RTI4 TaxID=3048640 RepID=UPI002AB4E3EE|nr:type IVB secretion system protein IcmH/DotU [Herbaspirillum sp. RTI4]MDY7579035.1 type IVB secretion system protein IcmH/DotU [Herbaspirillum sp. RTI4]MEA9982380.1 type IVB secretion system protein IcmH/DotU [Herbaspirillum sp. RTI4]
MNHTTPSLLNDMSDRHHPNKVSKQTNSLLDLMYDGFYAAFLLKNECAPQDLENLTSQIRNFLIDFEKSAKKTNIHPEDIDASQYAYCATVDEIILHSSFEIRDVWARRPLQLLLFGDQLAGEHFFSRLEDLRAKGSAHLPALEIFHLCLLIGFRGKYLIEGTEKLNYLTARLGDEIARMKGKSVGFAPHWERPDQVSNKLRNDLPLWVLCSVFSLLGLSAYFALNMMLSKATMTSISGYGDVVKLAPRPANLNITLP